MISAIIFDVGGVLGENNNLYAAKLLASRYNLDAKKLYTFLDNNELKFSTDNDTEGFFALVNEKYDIPIDKLKESVNLAPYYDNMLEIAKSLKNSYKVYILSNQTGFRGDYLRNDSKLRFFDKIFISDEIAMLKPNPEIFNFTLDQINKKSNECLFIDDRKKNIDTAKELGFNTIHFKNIEQFKDELKKFSISY